ncbi:alpha/beta fold hydrolase [Nesterenkonia ebinurensis]|uniref:alpha/beta fold hydrolase n=1 Tax=Nesterenkonia ebinurensis TaxID=2608252 RepID=UPI00123CD5BB|nr:alpha/beta fold hydrolase [Nesterenkonia ebinurensis]
MAHFILIPGLWLDASSWSRVAPRLEAARHTTAALSLPGDREATLQDWVETVVRAVDASAEAPVIVGHSAGCGVAYAALDARPDAVKHLVLIGGFPLPNGMPLLDEDFPESKGLIPLPDFSAFTAEDLAGLDDAALGQFRASAVPVPAKVLDDVLQLENAARRSVAITAICTEYSAADLQGWTAAGFAPTTEFPLLEKLNYIDLPTGHWPQFSRPEDLTEVLLNTAAG